MTTAPTPSTPPTPPAPDEAEVKLSALLNKILDEREAKKAEEDAARKPKSWVTTLFGE